MSPNKHLHFIFYTVKSNNAHNNVKLRFLDISAYETINILKISHARDNQS